MYDENMSLTNQEKIISFSKFVWTNLFHIMCSIMKSSFVLRFHFAMLKQTWKKN